MQNHSHVFGSNSSPELCSAMFICFRDVPRNRGNMMISVKGLMDSFTPSAMAMCPGHVRRNQRNVNMHVYTVYACMCFCTLRFATDHV